MSAAVPSPPSVTAAACPLPHLLGEREKGNKVRDPRSPARRASSWSPGWEDGVSLGVSASVSAVVLSGCPRVKGGTGSGNSWAPRKWAAQAPPLPPRCLLLVRSDPQTAASGLPSTAESCSGGQRRRLRPVARLGRLLHLRSSSGRPVILLVCLFFVCTECVAHLKDCGNPLRPKMLLSPGRSYICF